MKDNYELTPSRELPPNVLRASTILKQVGILGFWVQLVLGVIAAVILLIASFGLVTEKTATEGNPSGLGIFCATAGLIALVMSIFFFSRYINIAKLLRSLDSNLRPKKTETLGAIKFGLIFNLVGMFMSIMGAEIFVAIVLGKSLVFNPNLRGLDSGQFVNSTDIFIILANTHTIFAHFTGIGSSLWLLNRINK